MNYIQLSHIINPIQDEGTLNVTTAFSIILSDTLPWEVKFAGGFQRKLSSSGPVQSQTQSLISNSKGLDLR